MTRAEFIAVIAPVAVKLRRDGSPILPSVRIAQALLETGGRIHEWNNVVGYKVGRGQPNAYWKGRSVSTKTWEVYDGVRHDNIVANWRAYDSVEDCFRDQDVLFQSSRYDRVRAAKTPAEQAEMLRACGYATDPDYSKKLKHLIASYSLEQYDKEAAEVMLDEGVANTIIDTWMGPAWKESDAKRREADRAGNGTAAAAHQKQAEYIHWLANELRKASGQQIT
ncbi:Flagellum-specific peptidoglycan hydrolase FlgJ [Paenibacillus tianmuensis]|uniref:Flagellum-specific peptidoglycan hydrolase FlgJ n=1 Tax=Paenibacillus tianmuensis TaxID=624147 RepID=A0A1G4TN62_9BACL|nr:glucosaminidase domain-containing protein [Paenibacillus tianmuensis]SCW82762.1 Flagellum-specific peptidoglycan hydrolase FlgJ [Paenibacillus tianmuensis]